MSFFCIGLVRGYSAPAVPSILETDPDLLPTKDIASWASNGIHHFIFVHIIIFLSINCRSGSIPPTGAFCGSLLAGFMLQFVGRKNTIIISSPLATIGWILIATATCYEFVYLGRFITGLCVGLCLPSAQVYVIKKTKFLLIGVWRSSTFDET